MNKIFYIFLSVGVILVIGNIITNGVLGVLFLLPVWIINDVFGFDLIKFITKCQGEGCWLPVIVAGSISILITFILFGYFLDKFYERRRIKNNIKNEK